MVICLKHGVIFTHFTQNEQNLVESGKLDICFEMLWWSYELKFKALCTVCLNLDTLYSMQVADTCQKLLVI